MSKYDDVSRKRDREDGEDGEEISRDYDKRQRDDRRGERDYRDDQRGERNYRDDQRQHTSSSSSSGGMGSRNSNRERDDREEREERERRSGRNKHGGHTMTTDEPPSMNSEPSSIKAMVTEENGEISCSVEETNRIRALLGLKPLNLERSNKEAEAVDNFREKQENVRKEKESAELREKLEKAKEKRLLTTKFSGNGLGEVKDAAEGELLSAADWVKRSRKKEVDEKDKARIVAEQAARRREEEEEEFLTNGYGATDLKGLQVMHGAKEFEMGQDVILTLADSNILDTDEQGKILGIKDDADVLENVNMTDEQRRMEREKRAKRAKQPVYAGYDDAEFEEGVVPGTRQTILSHYDKEKKTGPKLTLGDDGQAMDIVNSSSTTAVETKKAIPQSLRVEAKEISDFYTKTEYTSFVKPNKSGKEKKRKLRKKSAEDVNDVDIKDILGDGSAEMGTDRGSRAAASSSSSVTATALGAVEAKRREDYQHAVKSAQEKSQMAFAASLQQSQSQSVIEEDDVDMAQSIARARRLAMLQEKSTSSSSQLSAQPTHSNGQGDAGAMHVKQLMARSHTAQNVYKSTGASSSSAAMNGGVSEMKTSNGGDGAFDDENLLDSEGRRPDGTLVFTDTTEFTSRLQARLTERARGRAEAAVRAASSEASLMDMQTLADLDDPSEQQGSRGVGAGSATTKQSSSRGEGDGDDEEPDDDENLSVMDIEEHPQKEEEEDVDEDDQMGFVHHQPLASSGMAATLALLKGTGELGKKEELAGRTKDERSSDPSSLADAGVKLEYRDEFGRKLTQKEAFRQLCYKFHGYGPGKKKQEKRLEAMERTNKAHNLLHEVGERGTMKSLLLAQEATGKAHVTIQGGTSAASTSISAAQLLAARNKQKSKNTSSSSSSAGAQISKSSSSKTAGKPPHK